MSTKRLFLWSVVAGLVLRELVVGLGLNWEAWGFTGGFYSLIGLRTTAFFIGFSPLICWFVLQTIKYTFVGMLDIVIEVARFERRQRLALVVTFVGVAWLFKEVMHGSISHIRWYGDSYALAWRNAVLVAGMLTLGFFVFAGFIRGLPEREPQQ